MFLCGHRTDAMVQLVNYPLIPLGGEVRTFAQTNAVTQQPAQLFGKRMPFSGISVPIHPFQFAQQMQDALLPIGCLD